MQSSAEGALVVAKLDDGDDLFARLRELAAGHRIGNGLVMWGIGMLRDLEVGYFNGTAYEREAIAGPMELVALHGTYAARADPAIHVHVAAAGADHRVVGGHLFRATVNVLNEVCVQRLDRVRMDRVMNPRSGLKELTLGP